MADNFNTRYKAFKNSIVQLINTSGIPAAVVRDYLAGDVISQLDRVVDQELAQEAEEEAQAEEPKEN